MFKLKWILFYTLLSTPFFTSNFALAGAKEYPIIKVDYGPATSFKSGAVGSMSIPVNELADAKVALFDGLVIIFSNGSNLSMETITDTSMGYAGVDMRTWPKYLLGLQDKGSEPVAFITELAKSREQIIDSEIAPSEVRTFITKQGLGYWAVGSKKSMIVFTSSDIKDQVMVVFAENMDESAVKKIIINGALK